MNKNRKRIRRAKARRRAAKAGHFAPDGPPPVVKKPKRATVTTVETLVSAPVIDPPTPKPSDDSILETVRPEFKLGDTVVLDQSACASHGIAQRYANSAVEIISTADTPGVYRVRSKKRKGLMDVHQRHLRVKS